MEDDIFDKFKHDSVTQLASLKPSDVVPFADERIPENYTLVVRPDEETIAKIVTLQSLLVSIEPDHYYYPAGQLHLTLIGFLPISLDAGKIIDVMSIVLKKYDLKFRIRGVGSNKYCASASAYPASFSIHEMRTGIRTALGVHGDDLSTHLAAYEYMGWINYMRYLHAPSQVFLDTLATHIDTDFGIMIPKSIELYTNTSKTLAPEGSKLIHKFL